MSESIHAYFLLYRMSLCINSCKYFGGYDDYLTFLETVSQSCLDISDVQYYSGDCFFFVDGSSLHSPDVVPLISLIMPYVPLIFVNDTFRLPSKLSALAIELYVLTRACVLVAGKSLTVFTDNDYTF